MKAIHGVITALVTPMLNEKIDVDSFKALLKYQLEQGVQGFVVNGTTGESPTLDDNEIETLFLTAKEIVGDQVPLILGIGSNSTAKTIENARKFENLKPDAYLVVTPYYNKPPQRGLVKHFKRVAESTQIPIILYNVPGRTITKIDLDTIVELSHHPNIIGIKEASGDLTVIRKGISLTQTDFIWLSGDDATAVDFCRSGGKGVISVVSHVLGAELRKALGESTASWSDYSKILEMVYIESNPIPIKAALKLIGVIESDELRLPLVSLEARFMGPLKTELLRLKKMKG